MLEFAHDSSSKDSSESRRRRSVFGKWFFAGRSSEDGSRVAIATGGCAVNVKLIGGTDVVDSSNGCDASTGGRGGGDEVSMILMRPLEIKSLRLW